jgi:choline-sulfatase
MPAKPNILLIVADQLSAQALAAYGNEWGRTPNIDRLVARGVRFENCYTACPLCQPTRASYWTGRWPHETGVLSNGRRHPVPPVRPELPTLGEIFTAGGYETVHIGKTHDAGSLRGFRHVEEKGQEEVEAPEAYPVNYDTLQDRYATGRVVEWLGGAAARPWLCVADLNNPHNICGWVGSRAGPHENTPLDHELPPLPENFRDVNPAERPLPVQYVCCSHNRLSQTAGWTDEDYRYYLDAYHHYIGRLDAEVGRILDALEARADAAETLVVFYADHGDGMVAHGMATKQVSFIEETMRVPLVFAGAGVPAGGGLRAGALTSTMDLLPTLCEVAGLAAPEGLWGRSLWPWVGEERADGPHEYVAGEWHTEWGFTISPGRMIRTARFKYTRYLEGDGEELYDLEADPGETRTLVNDPAFAAELAAHRRLLDEHLAATGDDFLTLGWCASPRWRRHAPGYRNHAGPAAPMVE